MSLYEQAVEFTATRDEFTRQRFQRVLRVGFVKRDFLLSMLIDADVIRKVGIDRFEVIR